jgi:hypothetical protein
MACPLSVLLSLLSLLAITSAKSGYLLTFPKKLQTNTEETICLTLSDIDFDLKLTLELRNPDTHNTIGKAHHVFRNGKGRCFKLYVPSSLQGDKVEIWAEGKAIPEGIVDYSFQADKLVVLEHNNLLTFIQPDKPVYKPGQIVKFRILSVKPDLKPLEAIINKVWVEDANGIRVSQWTDVQSEQGLSSLELVLSHEPVLGTWKISAELKGYPIRTQEFKVEEYVLPKYEVIIQAPSYVLVDAEKITAKICAED